MQIIRWGSRSSQESPSVRLKLDNHKLRSTAVFATQQYLFINDDLQHMANQHPSNEDPGQANLDALYAELFEDDQRF